jgi:hypothetical protein
VGSVVIWISSCSGTVGSDSGTSINEGNGEGYVGMATANYLPESGEFKGTGLGKCELIRVSRRGVASTRPRNVARKVRAAKIDVLSKYLYDRCGLN